jgi:hypothetical protein
MTRLLALLVLLGAALLVPGSPRIAAQDDPHRVPISPEELLRGLVLTPFEPGELPHGLAVVDIRERSPGGSSTVEVLQFKLAPALVIGAMPVYPAMVYYLYETEADAAAAFAAEPFLVEDERPADVGYPGRCAALSSSYGPGR